MCFGNRTAQTARLKFRMEFTSDEFYTNLRACTKGKKSYFACVLFIGFSRECFCVVLSLPSNKLVNESIKIQGLRLKAIVVWQRGSAPLSSWLTCCCFSVSRFHSWGNRSTHTAWARLEYLWHNWAMGPRNEAVCRKNKNNRFQTRSFLCKDASDYRCLYCKSQHDLVIPYLSLTKLVNKFPMLFSQQLNSL